MCLLAQKAINKIAQIIYQIIIKYLSLCSQFGFIFHYKGVCDIFPVINVLV